MSQLRTDKTYKEYKLQVDCDIESCVRSELFSASSDFNGLDHHGTQPTHPIYSKLIAKAKEAGWLTDNKLTLCPLHTYYSTGHFQDMEQIEFKYHHIKQLYYFETATHLLEVKLDEKSYLGSLFDINTDKYIVHCRHQSLGVAQ